MATRQVPDHVLSEDLQGGGEVVPGDECLVEPPDEDDVRVLRHALPLLPVRAGCYGPECRGGPRGLPPRRGARRGGPRRRRRAAPERSRPMASARARGSRGGARSPVSPSTTTSGMPWTLEATTG